MTFIEVVRECTGSAACYPIGAAGPAITITFHQPDIDTPRPTDRCSVMLEMTREDVVEMLEAGDLPLRLIDMVRENNEPITDADVRG